MTRSRFIAGLLLSAVAACGRGGDGNSSDGGAPDTGGTIDDNPRNVSGSFFVGDTSQPAAGYELLLVDWSDNSIRPFAVGSDGSVSLELTEFSEETVYSFHLINGDRKIGDLDLSSAVDGLQSAFNYRGGYGFSFGNVVVPLNAHGLIEVPATGLTADIGGGFSLAADDRSLKLEDIPPPDFLDSLSMRSSLVVGRADDLYHGYLNITDPSGAAALRAKYGSVSFSAESAAGVEVERIFISRISGWLLGSTVLSSAFADHASALPWSTSSYNLEKSDAVFSAEVLPGRDVSGRVVFLRIEGDEPPQIEIPRVVSAAISRPPVMEAISLSGGAPQTIDFTDTAADNGLTRPFCHSSGDVVATFSAPLDEEGAALDGDTFDQIVLTPVYYSQASGVTSEISGDAALASPYHADIGDTADGDFQRSWAAGSRTLTFTMTTANLAATQHTLTLPSALFPASLGGKTVTRVKVRYLFKAKNHSGKSGSVIWIRKNC